MTRAKRGRTTAATRGTKNRVLLGVRVSEAFHGRVLAECARRRMSLQKLVTSALQHYFNSEAPVTVTDEAEMNEWLSAREALKQVWEDYLDKMPLARIGLMYSGMTHDLVHGIDATPSKKETKMLKAYAAMLQNYAAVRPVLNPQYAEGESVMAGWVDKNPGSDDDVAAKKPAKQKD